MMMTMMIIGNTLSATVYQTLFITIVTHHSPVKRHDYFLHLRDEELRKNLWSCRAQMAQSEFASLTSPQGTGLACPRLTLSESLGVELKYPQIKLSQ
jgi:hypothetical protein